MIPDGTVVAVANGWASVLGAVVPLAVMGYLLAQLVGVVIGRVDAFDAGASGGIAIFGLSMLSLIVGTGGAGSVFAAAIGAGLFFACRVGAWLEAREPSMECRVVKRATDLDVVIERAQRRAAALPPHDPVTGEIHPYPEKAPLRPLERFEKAAARHSHRAPIPNLVAQVRTAHDAIQALGPDTGLPLTDAESRKLRRVVALIDGRLGLMLERLPRSAEPTENMLKALRGAAEDMAKLHAIAVRERVEAADIIGKNHATDRTPVDLI